MRKTVAMGAMVTCRWSAVASLILVTGSTTGCETCTITDGLYDPYAQVLVHPEGFDQWLAEHSGYFTEGLYDCMDDVIQRAYQRELDELRECDRWASDPGLWDVCRRGVLNPENTDAILSAIAAAARGEIAFANTAVGIQLIFTKADDPEFWEANANELLRVFGSSMRQGLTCEECDRWWIF